MRIVVIKLEYHQPGQHGQCGDRVYMPVDFTLGRKRNICKRRLFRRRGCGVWQIVLRVRQQQREIEFDQARVIADKPAHEHRAGKAAVVTRFQRLDLPRRQFELMRDIRNAHAAAFACRRQLRPGRRRRRAGRRRIKHGLAHSYWPAANARASRDSGKFLRNWNPMLDSALRSPMARSTRNTSHR